MESFLMIGALGFVLLLMGEPFSGIGAFLVVIFCMWGGASLYSVMIDNDILEARNQRRATRFEDIIWWIFFLGGAAFGVVITMVVFEMPKVWGLS